MMSVWLLLALVIVTGLVLLIVISKHNQPAVNKELVRSRWQKIIKYAEEGEAGQQQAVIEGDKLVDYVLRQYNINGESMADRMRGAKGMIPNYNDLWQAHKLRNKLVHEQNVQISKKELKLSLNAYRRTLEGLKAL